MSPNVWDRVKAHPFLYGVSLVAALVGVFESETRSGLLYFFGTWIPDLLVPLWDWLLNSHSLPGWAWVIAGILSTGGLLGAAVLVAVSISSESDTKPEETPAFVKMHFKGAVWRWQWEVRNNVWNAIDITAFCPVCDRVLVWGIGLNNVVFSCEGCPQEFHQGLYGDKVGQNKEITRIPGHTSDDAFDHVKREIHHRARLESKNRDSETG